jgi:hypothetical protein
MLKETHQDETVEPLETFLFCHLSEQKVFETALSSIMPVMEIAASFYGLNLKNASHWQTASRYVVNCAKYN